MLGNRQILDDSDIDPGVLAGKAEGLRSEGQTVMFIAVDGKTTGLLGVADPIKKSTYEAVALLRRDGKAKKDRITMPEASVVDAM